MFSVLYNLMGFMGLYTRVTINWKQHCCVYSKVHYWYVPVSVNDLFIISELLLCFIRLIYCVSTDVMSLNGRPKLLVGWRYGLFIGSLFGLVAAAMYPIAVYPMMHSDEYSKYYLHYRWIIYIHDASAYCAIFSGEMQKVSRKDIKQEDVQPGGTRKWISF